MAIVAKPLETSTSSTGAFNSVCGGTSYTYKRTFVKRAYIDTDYKLKSALGIPKLLMPYYISESVSIDAPGQYNGGNGLVSAYACFGGPNASETRDCVIEASNSASSVFYNKMAKMDSFNLAVSLAEMKETVGLVGSTAIRLANAYRYLRKGRVKDAFTSLGIVDKKKIHGLRGVPKNSPSNWTAKNHRKYLENRVPKADSLSQFAASTWLELQYGWTPLLYDIYGSAEYVAKLLHDTETDVIVKASATSTRTGDNSNSNASQKCVSSATVKYICHLKVSDPLLRNSASLGLTNPLNVAWELVPFSFVVDWFYPIGDTLNSLSALDGYSIVASSTSIKTTNNATMEGLNLPKWPCSARSTQNTFERTLGGIPSTPIPRVDLANLLDWKKAATSLSLLKVVFLNK